MNQRGIENFFSFFSALFVALYGAILIAANENSSERSLKFIPVPIYSTLPQEGETFGLMPVLMVMKGKEQRTESIFAPSYSWNANILHTGTFRWFYYPNEHTRLFLIPTYSSMVNRGVSVEFEQNSGKAGEISTEFISQVQRSIFFRFFGLGSHSQETSETSYTKDYAQTFLRTGYALTNHWNIGPSFGFQRTLTEKTAVKGLPHSQDRFPIQAGFAPSTIVSPGLSIRYDTRKNKEYSVTGSYFEGSIQWNAGLSGSPDSSKTSLDYKKLWMEFGEWLTGAARFYWTYVGGQRENIPFHQLSSLGGSYRMRGFTENRFFDRGSWSLEVEQRISLFQTNMYDVISDWKIDPFFAIGQVYDGADDVFDSIRIASGMGFRAWVRPNVLGRVDIGYAGEGLLVYVELGYPF